MDYSEFKDRLIKGTAEFYHGKAEVSIIRVDRNNGKRYDGVRIVFKDTEQAVPVVSIEGMFEAYSRGDIEMADCVNTVIREREKYDMPGVMPEMAESILNWENAKEKIYPILLSTDQNVEMLKNLASVPLLDMSTAYIIRIEIPEWGCGSVKVTKQMLMHYGIEVSTLHRQAVENLEKDGYRFRGIKAVMDEMLKEAGISTDGSDAPLTVPERMYILTNERRTYGAAGILHKKLIREFAQGQDYFILPSSIHETLFVPVRSPEDRKEFDSMVAEINGTQVEKEERLTDHCYYYDGQKDEIRMCA